MTGFTRMAVAASAWVALVAPSGAQAAQRDVDMGTPLKSQKAFAQTGSDVNAFFPRRTTIRVGDTVRFRPVGFHTLDLPVGAAKRIPLIVPTGQKIAGASDAAGKPFWFNGLERARLRAGVPAAHVRQAPDLHRGGARRERAADHRQAQAGDREVLEVRLVPLLLRRPPQDDGQRAGRLQAQVDPVRQGACESCRGAGRRRPEGRDRGSPPASLPPPTRSPSAPRVQAAWPSSASCRST